MSHLCTPHIRPEENIIAEQILLPGDPLRAKFIADNYLEHVQQFNGVRNMLGFTGTYKGQQVSVMGSGMGMPSMGIYSWELIHVFGVKKLMRIGSCAALQEHIKLYDMIISTTASTNSNYASQFELPGSYSPVGDYHMISRVTKQLDDLKMPYHVGGVLSTDIFYNANKNVLGKWKAMGILGVDMETAALYTNANYANVQAMSVMTVSDHIITGEETTSQEREQNFSDMMHVALESLVGSI